MTKMEMRRARLVLIHDAVVQPARVQAQAGACGHAPRAAPALPRARARAPVLHQQLRGKHHLQVHRTTQSRQCGQQWQCASRNPAGGTSQCDHLKSSLLRRWFCVYASAFPGHRSAPTAVMVSKGTTPVLHEARSTCMWLCAE